ncbi:MAG TPA: hypothetical protein VMH01_17165 [Puia sp.]|nr:hypothetical protein [Puia sp.]
MTPNAKLFCGIILVTVPTIQYGGYFLLTLLSGKKKLPLTDFQKSMFRAGHAHAGVLVILALIAEGLIDNTSLSGSPEWLLRVGFPLSAILVSGGFFGGAAGPGAVTTNRFIVILYVGVIVLAVSAVALGIALIKNS